MTRSKPFTFFAGAALIPLVALAVVGCGGGNDNGTATAAPPKTANGRTATIGVGNNSSLGKILVDSQGRTIYLFQKDSGTKSACFGDCAVAWPPVRANGKPTVGKGLTASKVGTIPRSDGKPQVTYNGHPLYLYQGPQPRRRKWPGPDGVRWRLVRAVVGREPGLRPGIELGRQQRQWLLEPRLRGGRPRPAARRGQLSSADRRKIDSPCPAFES